jgi:hypothetical protein
MTKRNAEKLAQAHRIVNDFWKDETACKDPARATYTLWVVLGRSLLKAGWDEDQMIHDFLSSADGRPRTRN